MLRSSWKVFPLTEVPEISFHEQSFFNLSPLSESECCLGIKFKCCFLTCFQAYVHKSVMEELKRIIDDSEITKEDGTLRPPPDQGG